MAKIAVIVAVANNNVIGAGNTIPWYCPADLQYFKRITLGSPVLMGRKTYQSLKIQPLPGRQNIIVTRDKQFVAEGCDVVSDLNQAFNLVEAQEKVFVIGGAEIYEQTLPSADELYITYVDALIDGDRYFPNINLGDWILKNEETYLADEKNPYDMSFKIFTRRP